MSARTPVAELGCEDYRIVKFTHDVGLATELMRTRLNEEYRTPVDPEPFRDKNVGKPRLAWIRIVPCLDSSYGAAEGWAFEYQPARANTRGAFRAVVFS